MATIDLSLVRERKAEKHVPISWAEQIGYNGEVYCEPFWDYNREGEPEDFGFDEDPREPTSEEFLAGNYIFNISPAEFAETAIQIAEKGTTNNFSFAERPYLRRIYDTGEKKTLLKCGRQVEKTLLTSCNCSRNDGSLVLAGDVKVGDKLASMATDGITMTTGVVTWVSRQYYKPCILIKTRQGHEITIALTHPMRTWESWTVGEKLSIGDRIAAVRSCGEFVNTENPLPERIRLTAYLIGDGYIGNHIEFVSMPGPTVNEFIKDVKSIGAHVNIYQKNKSKAVGIRISNNEKIKNWLIEDDLLYKKSRTKFIPRWVFGLNKKDTALFINRLWSTDGHVKQNNRANYSLEYCSTSTQLIKEVQALLWKFGIPSKIRRNWPNYWKKKGIKKYAWILRIETKNGIDIFLNEISCLGKSEHTPLPKEDSNNNQDTLPIEINSLIRQVIDSRVAENRYGKYADKSLSLRTAGLRETLKYPPTYSKIQEYVNFFRRDNRYNQYLINKLENYIYTDLYWDRIIEIKDVGLQKCVDFAVDETENFVAEGLITHNSTTLGNKMIGYSCLNNHFRSLFVSASAEQAKVFSYDRVSDVISISPLVKAYTNSFLTNAVFHKKFINYSQIRMRYAYLTADRVRGIPADLITIDEIQDILVDNIPVIEECASHSEWKLFIYSGTPKSLDNTLEQYWSNFSTQNEWLVPCKRHGTPKNPSSWHWNILDESNIGKKGLICDRCHEPIDPYCPEAQWAALNPQNKNNKDKVVFEGFRIPQLMVPWILKTEKGWREILQKLERYSRQDLYNEVLGLSYDSGIRPITKAQLKANCKNNIRLGDYEHFRNLTSAIPVFAGIDWGCHDEETRILTQNGWKYFRDLTDDDLVAQWDPETRVMSLVIPEVKTVRDWNNPLYHFKTRGGLDLMVTHTHRMHVKNGNKWVTEYADQTIKRKGDAKFVGYINWEGEEKEFFELPGFSKSPGYQGSKPLIFKMDDWLEFFGYIVAEGGVCLKKNKSDGSLTPYVIKMSQRESSHPEKTYKIRTCMDRMKIPYSEFPNTKTGDVNWAIYGKQYWQWFAENMGCLCGRKRIPRYFLSLSKRQLRILFDAMLLGDGYIDKREGCDSGSYNSTSRKLCEDFQEICIRLGYRCTVSLRRPAKGNKNILWAAYWSKGKDYHFNCVAKRVKKVPYSGKVYCCKVPSGYIVTERNGCVSYQGNTGEGSYSVIALGAYLGTGNFTVFWVHRFVGRDLEPPIQLDRICTILSQFNVIITGCDYGGGFDRNDHLIRAFGPLKIFKYQYNAKQKKGKIYWEEKLGRFAVHRTEVMSDIFNALIRRQIDLPAWDDFEEPYGQDILNIFSEVSKQLRMTIYDHKAGTTDDTFHAILLCFLASMIKYPRPDIISPRKDSGEDYHP